MLTRRFCRVIKPSALRIQPPTNQELARAADTIDSGDTASNQKDFSPFKSQIRDPYSKCQWRGIVIFRQRNCYRGGDLVKALLAISEAESIDPNRADLQFIKGNVLFDQMHILKRTPVSRGPLNSTFPAASQKRDRKDCAGIGNRVPDATR